MRDSLKRLWEKARRRKKKEPVVIPPDHVQCVRCRQWVPEGKAVMDLDTNQWVCEKCFFPKYAV